jgi:hypothetical protein
MLKCKDQEQGKLLLAYELGGLSEQENERFEIHLIECEHCFNELKGFERESSLLSQDTDIKDLIGQSVGEIQAETKSLLGKVWRYLWPETRLIYKPALAYFLILLMIVPAYRGIMESTDSQVRTIQNVMLLPDRSVSDNVFKLGTSQDGLISFVYRGAQSHREYTVIIETENGREIFRDDDFTGFDDFETGRLLLPLDGMEPGVYLLVISDPGDQSPLKRQERTFRIEP